MLISYELIHYGPWEHMAGWGLFYGNAIQQLWNLPQPTRTLFVAGTALFTEMLVTLYCMSSSLVLVEVCGTDFLQKSECLTQRSLASYAFVGISTSLVIFDLAEGKWPDPQ